MRYGRHEENLTSTSTQPCTKGAVVMRAWRLVNISYNQGNKLQESHCYSRRLQRQERCQRWSHRHSPAETPQKSCSFPFLSGSRFYYYGFLPFLQQFLNFFKGVQGLERFKLNSGTTQARKQMNLEEKVHWSPQNGLLLEYEWVWDPSSSLSLITKSNRGKLSWALTNLGNYESKYF